MSGLQPKTVDRRAVALAAFRQLPGGRGRQYTAATFPANPYQGCEHMIRMARAVGFVTDSAHGAYAALDVLDARDRAVWLAHPVVSEALCAPAEAFAQALAARPPPDGWRGGALASLRSLAAGALHEVADPWPWTRDGDAGPVARFWLDHDEACYRWTGRRHQRGRSCSGGWPDSPGSRPPGPR